MKSLLPIIVPATPAHIERFHATLDAVAREGLYLASLEAKPIESLRGFVMSSIEKGNPIVFAMDGEQLVGWCDITRPDTQISAHCGHLGMGVLSDYRGKGIGTQLIRAALKAASEANIPRVELTVYANNTAAIGLYRKVGFVEEGRMRGYAVLKKEFVDAIAMARLDEAGMERFLMGVELT
jgi:ribosomal protein S18 acetylase RimI-like enzyme